MRNWLFLSGAVAVFDQLSKAAASQWLAPHEAVPLFPGVQLVLVHNTGAAFSLLAGPGEWRRWLLLTLTAALVAFLGAWLRRLPPSDKFSAAGISLIIGGAVGNFVDRAVHGWVVDFVDLHYQGYHWPAFNLADAAITGGALALIAVALLDRKNENTAG